ncbi:MAG: SpoIID/LytB domain-containing protein, partial [Acidobacteria bacterium]|nr:SpoIID/LytB domain-containing protein [Acidobacteriota bacterium]
GRTFQVRLGRFATREQAERFAGKLLRGGQPGWVVEASVSTAASSGKVGLHARRNELFKVSSQGFYVTPESGDRLLELEGKKYRGAVEVFANRQGRLTVVNVLGMEEYLRGVVPNELSPYTYPELEALKAQAVAARTYALRHRDGFARDGYDLMATDRSQVYGGADAERPLSSRAVEETRGIAATYAGEPIQAFYSSTCGGMTENFENIFGGAPIPYLRGVTCAPEQGAEGLRWSTNGTWSSLRVFAAEDRKSLAREVALALTLGLDHASSWSAEDWASPVRREELRSWVESVGVLRDAPAIPDGPDALEVHSWVNWLVRRAYGNVLLNAADVDYLLYSIRDEAEIPEPSRPSVAHLVQKHLVLPFPDSTVRPRLRLSRGLALRLLIAILADARLLPLERGTVVESSEGGSLRIRSGGQEAEVKASPRAFLVKQAGSDYLPVESLHFVGGELVAYRTNGREVLYLEAAPNPKGASSDRFSPFSHWEVRYSRQELLKKLRGKLPLRDVVDLQPARYGVSGRVIELKVVHSGAPLVLRPGEIRNYLGLRDTLFSIQRETNAAGQIEAFLFTGRGWGHGVGLCQVGAFGMARAGQSYQRILKTYYRGVEVERLY